MTRVRPSFSWYPRTFRSRVVSERAAVAPTAPIPAASRAMRFAFPGLVAATATPRDAAIAGGSFLARMNVLFERLIQNPAVEVHHRIREEASLPGAHASFRRRASPRSRRCVQRLIAEERLDPLESLLMRRLAA